MNPVAQSHAFALQLLRKTRPCAQFDKPWISNLQATEQMPIAPYSVGQHVGIQAIILGAGDTEPVT
jgi:hypothetical protein